MPRNDVHRTDGLVLEARVLFVMRLDYPAGARQCEDVGATVPVCHFRRWDVPTSTFAAGLSMYMLFKMVAPSFVTIAF